ncbi:MAG: TorD/DmsD family molecular chaperone [Flaviflexus sp.]|uniref:TorD/DmsD family molecular chaperone n=1 Tax=Flaviflexus sp. TaxID=1969482 RepID=UPI003F8F607B
MNPSLPSPEFLDRMAAAFATLGRLHLQSPDQETLDQLAELLDEWPIEDEGDTAFGLKELRASLAEKEEVAQIRRDHNLLYGVTAGAKVPPYESVHRNRDGLIFDEETLQVRSEYRKLGLQAPKLNQEPDDHIGLEFNFIAQSCLRSLDALDQDSTTDASRYYGIGAVFMEQHIMEWAPAMLEEAAEAAETRFYRGIMYMSLGALAAYAVGQ